MGFEVNGLDSFSLSLAELAELPDSVQDDMLLAGAEVVAKIQKKKVLEYGIYDGSSPTHVANSIKPGRVKLKETRNAEILFVNEYGKNGQAARPAVRDANEASAEEMTQAQFDVYDQWLKSKNL